MQDGQKSTSSSLKIRNRFSSGDTNASSSTTPGIGSGLAARFRLNKRQRGSAKDDPPAAVDVRGHHRVSSVPQVTFIVTSPEDKSQPQTPSGSGNDKRKGRFKSLDLRKMSPRVIFRGGPARKTGDEQSKVLSAPLIDRRSNSFSSRRDLHMALLTDLEPYLPLVTEGESGSMADSLNLSETSEYELYILDVMFRRTDKVTFRFTDTTLLEKTSDQSGWTQFDYLKDLSILDVGQLISQPCIFQISSTSQGIKMYEAQSPAEKSRFIHRHELSSAGVFTARNLTGQLTDDDEEPESESHDESYVNKVINRRQSLDALKFFTPAQIIGWQKERLKAASTIQADIDKRVHDLDVILGHLKQLDESTVALEEDFETFHAQIEKSVAASQHVSAEETAVNKKISAIDEWSHVTTTKSIAIDFVSRVSRYSVVISNF